MAKIFIALMVMLTSFAGCADHQGVDKTEAIAIADRRLAATLPQMPRSMLRAHVVDQGARWRVDYYPAAPNSMGGVSVGVDKQSGEVVEFVIQQ